MAHPHDRSGSSADLENDLPNIFQQDPPKRSRDPATGFIHANCDGCGHPGVWFPGTKDFSKCTSCPGASPGKRPIEDAIFSRLHSTSTSDAAQSIQLDLLWKFSRGDWHGVSDAANDLRVLEATEAKR